nr:hypothetical protein [Tanacetum cinerariifolium]
MAPKRTAATTTTSVIDAQVKTLIYQGVVDALAERDADRSRIGDDNHDSGTGVRRQAPVARECTYSDFLKCQPLNFKGTEGVVGLTQWFEKMEYVFHISNYTVAYKYCPRGEIKNLEIEMWDLKVKGTDVVSYNQRFQELTLMYDRMFLEESDEIEKYVGGLPDMIHESISTHAERQAENKKKLDNINQASQQPPKKQGVAISYTFRSGERNEYAGTLPLSNKYKFHHNVQCTVKCANCKRVGDLAQDYRSPATTNNQRNLTCYECRNQGHYRSDFPEIKNQNHENQAGGTGARKMVHALGGGETNQDINNM